MWPRANAIHVNLKRWIVGGALTLGLGAGAVASAAHEPPSDPDSCHDACPDKPPFVACTGDPADY